MHFAFKCQQRVVTIDRVCRDPDIVFVIVINCCQLKINNIIDTMHYDNVKSPSFLGW